MKIEGLELKASMSPMAYIGIRLWIDGATHRVGDLLGFGEEKWVFELLDGDDNPVDKVIKIYRDEDGNSARKDAFMSQLMKDGPIQVLDIEICQVPGGYVGIQTRVESVSGQDSAAARRAAIRREIILKLERGESIDYEAALGSARNIEDKELEANLLQHRAISLLEVGQSDQALIFSKSALDLFEELGDVHGMLRTCNAIGEAYRAAGRSNDARFWYERSRSIAEQCGATSSLGIVYHNLGILCQNEALGALESGEDERAPALFDEAEQCLRKSLEVWHNSGDSVKEAQTLGQLGRLSLFRKALDKAEEFATQALRIREVIGLPDVFIDYNTLGMVALARSDDATAAEWFKKRDAAESRVHGASASGGGVMISVGAIAEACVESGLKSGGVSSELESALIELETSGPSMDTVAKFLRRIADGDFPEHVPDYEPPIFRDYLIEVLQKVKASRGGLAG